MVAKLSFEDKCREMIECQRCAGDCCGPQIMDKVLYDKHRDKIKRPHQFFESGHMVGFITEDQRCVFLDDHSKCMIYEERPKVCRDFGITKHLFLQCPFIRMDGTLRPREERRELKKQIAKGIKKLHDKMPESDDSEIKIESR